MFCHQKTTRGGRQDAGGIGKELERNTVGKRDGRNKGGGPQARGKLKKLSRETRQRRRELQESVAYLLKLATGGFSDDEEEEEYVEEEAEELEEVYGGGDTETAYLVEVIGVETEQGRPNNGNGKENGTGKTVDIGD